MFISHWLGLFLDKPSVYLECVQDSDGKHFICKRGFDRMLADSCVLLVDDVINSGYSLNQCKQVIENLHGHVSAVAALIDRGNVAENFFHCPKITLATYQMPSWPADECPLCRDGVPINTDFAHGREFVISH